MHLARFPRVRLVHAPTPLEFLPRLTEQLGGPRLYIKRDDCTGLATGGNKTRKLEFLLGDALAQGATHIVTHGATQSNHVRQTAAAAARLGLQCTALLEARIADGSVEYRNSGNVFLDRLFGARLEHRPAGLDMNAEVEQYAARLREQGEKAYAIPGGGSNHIGALGYVASAQEILQQADAAGIVVHHVVHATGSTGTQAGLVAGFQGSHSGVPVLGISVRAERAAQEDKVWQLASRTLQHLGVSAPLPREAVRANSDYVGAGYGRPTPEMVEALTLLARTEGILLDPVYSGKGFAGLLDLIRKGHFRQDENVVFVHTGGAVGLFGYRDTFDPLHAAA
ncbi:D-cysteine desulfhydrase [Pseudothauera nasutitermitis]|uniref:L-cysteate sulfo-lyase n=1 Tax=Pseudothauera nasutitermitis TaxID=2565930 RepID=A0A4S4B8N3_9RHOO|nr:D-cysteine desulfhydrase [Pseudothauera nasutitermitis]THF67353.1 D-cysteine desulfhydrase [Pseudothauera nasutitermitis]